MNSRKKRALTGFTLILMYILGFLVFWFLNFQRVVVRGNSMLPTFHDGQVLWTSKSFWLVGPIQRDNVVVIRREEEGGYIIKRVKWLAGEPVPVSWEPPDFSFEGGANMYVVPANSYFVLGDNQEISEDSHDFGPVHRDDIIGKYVPFTWAAFLLAVPVILFLLYAFSRPKDDGHPSPRTPV